MARPVWSGVLTFGLVTVPVALYTATEDRSVRFHQLQRGTSDRVRNKRVNERTGKEVPYADIVKGYELTEGEYVVVEPEELEQISPGRSKTIDISGFVDLDEIDPIYFDRTYYLGPRSKEYAKIYALLTQSLERSHRAGLAMFAMRGKEYLTAVRAEHGLLELHTMHFADEVRDPRREVDGLPGEEVKPSTRELDTAEQLIGMLEVDWDPQEYHDTYAEQVRKLVEDKAAGREIAVSEGPPAEATNVVDLMDVLRRSLEGARGGKAPSAAVGSADEAPAAGKAAAKKSAARTATAKKSAATTAAARKATGGRAAANQREDLGRLTKAELYQRATDLDIPHRSTMNRDELLDAVRKAGRKRLRAAS
ncbi:Ku protein [Kitasatospora sp. A2-31]|uniref:non-homologous end joining protein Ku n=1 Tax=Kitasatospora sp. A2-31 TaxID=2916414 RepID=UPI001EEC1DC2|nr:Ku protein [Kitasatospora sp. A2-31]MCG6494259.1 Ku protein [Kitasatospora sp. A2-31]